jgi:hypothetical protein
MNEFGDTAVSQVWIIDVEHLLNSDQDIEGAMLNVSCFLDSTE